MKKLEYLGFVICLGMLNSPLMVLADDANETNDPFRTYHQFQTQYQNSNFSVLFNKVLSVAFQGIIVLAVINIILAVGSLVVSGAKLGMSNTGPSRAEAQNSLLKQAVVFGLIGITPLIFTALAAFMISGQ